MDQTMPVFNVLRRVDAFVDYVSQVDAADEKAASEAALRDEDGLKWRRVGEHEFDARLCVTLGPDGKEIESTQVGDF